MTLDYQYIDPGPGDPACTKNRYFALKASSFDFLWCVCYAKGDITVAVCQSVCPSIYLPDDSKTWWFWMSRKWHNLQA